MVLPDSPVAYKSCTTSPVRVQKIGQDSQLSNSDSDTNSLFDDTSNKSPRCSLSPYSVERTGNSCTDRLPVAGSVHGITPAQRTAPPIPGLYFDSSMQLSSEVADDLMWTCVRTYFHDTNADQVMLFERAPDPSSPSLSGSGLPPFLTDLLGTLSTLLRPSLPPETYALLFPSPSSRPALARQAILNFYWPGEGITPHVDLLNRYDDGIIGVSFGSGCVMRFDKVVNNDAQQPTSSCDESTEMKHHWGLYLPSGSVIVLSQEARYAWTHGIDRHMEDLVEDAAGTEGALGTRSSSWISRGVRLSITFRWLLPGADIVGDPEPADDAECHT
ncbi:hypothetical protein AcV7_002830 [Taiwanofungus camphoratus]|nr:hypothetical protein AcV7_002830 [Antrodia cinnamomea]